MYSAVSDLCRVVTGFTLLCASGLPADPYVARPYDRRHVLKILVLPGALPRRTARVAESL